MTYNVFKQKVENLKIPWVVTTNAIYNPIYMNPKDGYFAMGRNFLHPHFEDYLEDFYTEIVNLNRTTKIYKEYVEIFNYLNKQYYKILC